MKKNSILDINKKRLETVAKELGRDHIWNLELMILQYDNLATDLEMFNKYLKQS